MTTSVRSDPVWISGREARRRAGGLTPNALLKLAAMGVVCTRAVLGEALRYSASDVEQLSKSQESVD